MPPPLRVNLGPALRTAIDDALDASERVAQHIQFHVFHNTLVEALLLLLPPSLLSSAHGIVADAVTQATASNHGLTPRDIVFAAQRAEAWVGAGSPVGRREGGGGEREVEDDDEVVPVPTA